MLTLTDPFFWINFLYFFVTVFVAFYIPGSLLIRKLKISNFQSFILSLITGMVLWAWQGFIFGYLQARWFSYIYLIITFFIWLKLSKKLISLPRVVFKQYNFLLISIIIIGTLLQLLTTFFVGVLNKEGMYFCCALPDSLYHIALTNQIVRQFPPIEPGASNIIVHNYHYWSNLIAAELIRVFKLPLIATQYQYLVLLISVLYGLSAVVFGQILKIDKKYIYWLVFFLYFSGDLTFVLLLFLGKGLNFDLPFLENAGWLWISPPRVFASVIFFGGISLLTLWFKNRKFYLGFLSVLILSSLIGIKIYVGLFALSGLAVLGIYYLYKKNYSMILPLIFMPILSLIIYLPVNADSNGLIFTGLWRFENFIVSTPLGLSHLELARQIYLSHNNLPRLIQSAVIYISLYFVFVFGTIMLGFFQTKKSLSLLGKELNIFLISGILISLLIGSFFIQQTGGANSSQFLITVDIIASIYAALTCFFWAKKISLKYKTILVLIIIVLTIPRISYIGLQSIKSLSSQQGFMVNNNELQALDYLKKNTSPNSIILIDNIDKNHWRNAFSYYISFLSDKQIVVDGNGIAQDHGINVENKIKDAETIFKNENSDLVFKTLQKNNIDYIYLSATDYLISTDSAAFLENVFENKEIKILKFTQMN